MGHRVLQIKNYKNVGIDEKQELLLNASTSKGEFGGLVILIGPNNSGKTNVLSALTAMRDPNFAPFTAVDLPDFDNAQGDLEVSLVIHEGKAMYGFNKKYSNKIPKNQYFAKKEDGNTLFFDNKDISENVMNLAMTTINTLHRVKTSNYPNEENWIVSNADWKTLKTIDKSNLRLYSTLVHDFLNKVMNFPSYGYHFFRNNIDGSLTEERIKGYINELGFNSEKLEVLRHYEDKNNFSILPNIVLYSPVNFKNSDLTIQPGNINTSNFYKHIFKAIDYDIEELKNCYTKVKEQSMPGLLKKTAKTINNKLEDLSEQFNKLFHLNKNKYTFEITLETNSIYLTLMLNETPLHLDKQSLGFKWFFEFYFTMVAKSGLNRGDIIVMDEPATNLHVSGIVELRKFIKEYAERNELTFVLSTHNPFFIDVNYLEEVRVINRVGDHSVIQSKFHLVEDDENDDTDAIRPIKDALTVPRHILVDPNVPTIYVEGITDYLYLTAFASILKIDKFLFMPIQGISKKNLVDTILKIDKNPIFLVDGDKPAIQFKEMVEKRGYKNVEVISLIEVDESFKNIEQLFDATDRLEKSFINAANFKARIKKGKLNKVTKDNFSKLFDYITV
jgi:predicted ATP-dependent endonuclease of OLD family